MGRLGMCRWGALAALVLAASASAAGRLMVVAPRAGDVLAPVEAALRAMNGAEVLAGADLSPALERLKLRPKDLATEARVLQVAHELGATGLLTAKPRGRGAGAALEVALSDAQGHVVWSSIERLKRGRLPDEVARRIARKVVELLPEEAPKPAPPPPAKAEEKAVAPARSEPFEAPKPMEARAPAEPAPAAKPDSTPAVKKPDSTVAALKPEPVAVAEASEEPETAVTAPVPERPAGERSVAIPFIEVSAGAVALWRNQEFCPGVARCGDKTLDPAQTIRYTTDAPYFGPAVRAAVFPLARWSSPLRGLGVTGSYARGFLQTAVPDPTSGQTLSLPTYDEDFSAEVVYRLAFRLGIGEPSIGVRGGLMGRRFVLPANAVVTESRRNIGPVVGAELALPLWDPHLRLEATARYAPSPLPGSAERAAYGGDKVTATGLFASAGLAGQFDEGWGYALMAEYTAFVDTYSGQGQRANGGAAHEEYYGMVGLLRYRF